MVDGNKLNSVLEFSYLGSTISSNGCMDDEIQRMMAKTSASFGRLRQRLSVRACVRACIRTITIVQYYNYILY